ncbi:hypothetical protein ZWY2020_036374 [Hordeum vulgare]|nr:hypothetical protein ZWY2020_036374 [Hordeum vulgare]
MEEPPVWTSARAREVFINHFESNSVIPVDDPAILFANAGMNRFQPLFLGTDAQTNQFKRIEDSQLDRLRRACNTQERICAEAQGSRRRGEGGGRHRHRACMGAPVGFLPSLPLFMLVCAALLYLYIRLWIGKV